MTNHIMTVGNIKYARRQKFDVQHLIDRAILHREKRLKRPLLPEELSTYKPENYRLGVDLELPFKVSPDDYVRILELKHRVKGADSPMYGRRAAHEPWVVAPEWINGWDFWSDEDVAVEELYGALMLEGLTNPTYTAIFAGIQEAFQGTAITCHISEAYDTINDEDYLEIVVRGWVVAEIRNPDQFLATMAKKCNYALRAAGIIPSGN